MGVYVCYCGGNISDEVDVEKVCEQARKVPGVVVARANMFMCSDPGQEMIIEDLQSGLVDRVVVASCSPSLHETTFRQALARAGANPYVYEHANLREQVSWVHHGAEATEKATRLVAAAAAKAGMLEALEPMRVEVHRQAVVIGGGVAGLKTALELAERGLPVILVEKSPFLGGQVAQLDRLAPWGETASGVISELAGAVLKHPAITAYTCAQVEDFEGYIGNFKLKIVRQPPEGTAYADSLARLSHSGQGLGEYVPFVGVMPAAIPESREEVDLDAGVIVLATGFRPYQPRQGEYGYQEFPEVVTLPEFIRLLAEASTGDDTLMLHGRPIRRVAMIHCVGSRQIPGIHEENEGGYLNEYCSRTCCSATLYAANLIRDHYPQTRVFDFYRDIRTYGRGQEELYTQAAQNRVVFFRFEAGEEPQVLKSPTPKGYPLLVKVKDVLTFGEELEVPVDLVVLAVGQEPNNIADLVETDEDSRGRRPFPPGGAPQAAPGGSVRGRHPVGRHLPGPLRRRRDLCGGGRRGGQGRRDPDPGLCGVGSLCSGSGSQQMHRHRRLCYGLPGGRGPGHGGDGRGGPEGQAGPGQPGPMPGLRRLCGGLPRKRH